MKFQTTNNKKQINFKFQIQNSKPFLIKAILIFYTDSYRYCDLRFACPVK